MGNSDPPRWALFCAEGCATRYYKDEHKESAARAAITHQHPVILYAPGTWVVPEDAIYVGVTPDEPQ